MSKCFEFGIKVGRNEHIDLMDFCDIHAGSIGFAEDELIKNIEWLRNTPNAYGILGGDSVDMIGLTDKRFDVRTVDKFTLNRMDDMVVQLSKRIIDLFTPVKEKLLFKVRGNHEETIHKNSQFDVCKYIAEGLGIQCGENDNFVNLSFSRGKNLKTGEKKVITMYVGHKIGGGGGGTSGAKLNKLVNKVRAIEADIYLAEHTHEIIYTDKPRLRVTRNGRGTPRLVQDKKLYAICGSYLKTNVENTTTYSETGGFEPVELGNPIIRINPFPTETRLGDKKIQTPARYGVVKDI